MTTRIQAAEDAIATLASSSEALALVSPARLPAPSTLSTWRPLFSQNTAVSINANASSSAEAASRGGALGLAATAMHGGSVEGHSGTARGPQVAGRETVDLYHASKQAQQRSYTTDQQVRVHQTLASTILAYQECSVSAGKCVNSSVKRRGGCSSPLHFCKQVVNISLNYDVADLNLPKDTG